MGDVRDGLQRDLGAVEGAAAGGGAGGELLGAALLAFLLGFVLVLSAAGLVEDVLNFLRERRHEGPPAA
jgi:hypothetical protein